MIILKEHSFEESSETLTLTVPVKGCSPSATDVYCNDSFIKISSPPFLFQADIIHPIDDTKTVVTFARDVVRLKLVKQAKKVWGTVLWQGEDVEERRKAAVLRKEAQEQQIREQRLTGKRQEERKALRKQIELDEKERESIAVAKQAAHDAAMAEVLGGDDHKSKEDLSLFSSLSTGVDDAPVATAAKQVEALPDSVRHSAPVGVDFTPRILPTPARQAREQEEADYLQNLTKQADVAVVDVPPSLPSEPEDSPAFLKAKGDQFAYSGHDQLAIDAYTHAIKQLAAQERPPGPALDAAQPSLPSGVPVLSGAEMELWRGIHANRAAAHLHMALCGPLSPSASVAFCAAACLEDTESVLKTIPPAKLTVSAVGRRIRSRILARKGAASILVGRMNDAVECYKEAVLFAPDSTQAVCLKQDVQQIESSILYVRLKQQADHILASAVAAYDQECPPAPGLPLVCYAPSTTIQRLVKHARRLYDQAMCLRKDSVMVTAVCRLNQSLAAWLVLEWSAVRLETSRVEDSIVSWCQQEAPEQAKPGTSRISYSSLPSLLQQAATMALARRGAATFQQAMMSHQRGLPLAPLQPCEGDCPAGTVEACGKRSAATIVLEWLDAARNDFQQCMEWGDEEARGVLAQELEWVVAAREKPKTKEDTRVPLIPPHNPLLRIMSAKLEKREEDEEEDIKEKSKDQQDQSKDLERLQRIDDEGKAADVDEQKAAAAVSVFSKQTIVPKKDTAPKIKLKREDVDTVVKEMEVPRDVAERFLQQAKGDMEQALQDMVNAPTLR